MKSHFSTVLLLLTLSISTLTHADQSLEQIKVAAEHGDAKAQVALGVRYNYGQGVPRNVKLARKWYRQAAEHGNIAAQIALGESYGQKPHPNLVQAVKWLKPLADQGNREAYDALIALTFENKTLKFSDHQMFLWNLKLARLDPRFALMVAQAYELGSGVQQDYAQALDWYLKVTQSGKKGIPFLNAGLDAVGRFYEYGLGVKQSFSKAAYWYQKSALYTTNIDSRHALSHLGRLYCLGLGVKQSNAKAQALYTKVNALYYRYEIHDVQKECTVAAHQTAIKASEQDYIELISTLKRDAQLEKINEQVFAARQNVDVYTKKLTDPQPFFQDGDHEAQRELAEMYYQGIALPEDQLEGILLLENLAKQGDISAEHRLGVIYTGNSSIDPWSSDYSRKTLPRSRGDFWALKAAEDGDKAGDIDSTVWLGEHYLYPQYMNGSDTTQLGIDYYQKAADAGNAIAEDMMGKIYSNKYPVTYSNKYPYALENGYQEIRIATDNKVFDAMQDYEKAAYWYQKAADQGNQGAEIDLAKMYRDGVGVKQDVNKAIELFMASDDFYVINPTYVLLSQLTERGKVVPWDYYSQAVAWYQKAVAKGAKAADVNDGFMSLANQYEHGLGVKQDKTKALALYIMVAKLGNREAATKVKELESE